MNQELFQYLMNEINTDFNGWDFSYLAKTERMTDFPLSWNYTNIISTYLKNSKTLLDMGTGGGEYLSTFHDLPAMTYATEGYEPNFLIAKKRLEPLGVHVFPINDDSLLPFEDATFDLIINRHESYDPKEVKRILKPQSFFITQQVGGHNDQELNQLLEASPSIYSNWDLTQAVKELQDEHFQIILQKEEITKTRFYDVGALVYYLKAIPWQIPDFSVIKYYSQLEKMNEIITENGFIDVSKHRFILIAKKENL